jgi:hypothetical protein
VAWLKGPEIGGYVNIAKNINFKGSIVQQTPFVYHYYNDFFTYAAGDWTVTEIGAGGTEALTDGAGGQLLITTDALDNDGVQIQNVNEAFLPAAGKDIWFESRIQLVTAAKHVQSDLLVGLADLDTTILDAPSDGIYFTKADGSADVSAATNVGSSVTSTAGVLTLASATWYRLGFYVHGDTAVYFYVDGVLVATHTDGITATELTPTFAVLNGEAGATAWKIDYFNVSQVR